ncbi:MAG: serine/threonine-protein kinase [Anaerolineales bacterium]|nr:serine/threonine-protein kinase [Anaerolineales bacterium]
MAKDSLIGHSLGGRYKIEELLGRGGMSSVYKATDPNLKRVVAVKLIHPHLSDDPEFVRRFETEASSVAQLRHPNIVQVYDFNSEEETYYMVLEFIPGETLQTRLKRMNDQERRLDIEDTVDLGASISDAVGYAHSQGMIHRDIKPANILINVQGEAILMDFGIAKIVGGTQHTATGAVLGTALYMSPEQIRGEHPDHRTDIYSLGVTLFEMVGGRPPYEADSVMSVMMMHLHDPLPDLTAINPDTPPGLVAVINKALAKEPADRYQTAGELTAALKAATRQDGIAPEAAAALAADITLQEEAPLPVEPEATFMEEPVEELQTPGATHVEAGAPPVPAEVAPDPTPPSAGAAARSAPETAPGGGGGFFSSTAGRIAIFGGGGLVLLVIVAALAAQLFGGSGAGEGNGENGGGDPGSGAVVEATLSPSTLTAEAVALIDPTDTPLPPTVTSTVTRTPTPSITPSPTTTPPPEPFVLITDITVDGGSYVVDYETFGYTEQLPGMHVHFYYDTVPESEAGSPGNGPWILYGGPRPFQGYSLNSRPGAATQMCARVANPNHSIIFNSGNCFDLPDA